MELWNETNQWIQIVFNVLMVILPVLAGVASTGVFGAAAIRGSKKVYAEYIRPAIDEPTDPIIMLISQKTGRDPKVTAEFLRENLDAVIAALPAVGLG